MRTTIIYLVISTACSSYGPVGLDEPPDAGKRDTSKPAKCFVYSTTQGDDGHPCSICIECKKHIGNQCLDKLTFGKGVACEPEYKPWNLCKN